MKKILRGILSLLLIVYLVIATRIASAMSDADTCKGLFIEVNDNSATPFVTASELDRELNGLTERAVGMRFDQIDTDSIRSMLSSIDKIEHVEVVRRSDGTIHVIVEPMRPIARVFDGRRSYYINREGKRMAADARYRIDVPVVQGYFTDTVFTPSSLIPLLDFLDTNEKWGTMVTMIKVDSPTDVLLIPAIRGQVINIGAPTEASLADKFSRLDRIYADVLPVKGWNYYDTISVKWSGQVVATRRDKTLLEKGYIVEEEDDDIDVNTMLAGDNVAPGQSLPGKKAKGERPIPGNQPKVSPQPAKAPDSTATKTKPNPPKTPPKDAKPKG